MERLAALLMVTVLAIACGEPGSSQAGPPGTGGSPGGSSHDYEGTWQLTEGFSPEGAIAITEQYRITMIVEGDTVGGISACNHYGAEATIEGSSFHVSGVGGTDMGCLPEVMESETRYHSALMAADTIRRDGDMLTVTGPEVELVYRFVPPPPTVSLTDVAWELESLVYGRGPDATASSAHPATLRLGSDGTVSGNTGCKPMEGEWTESGDSIVFTYFSVEGNCPEELEEQHGHVINIADGFTFEIDGRTLTIYGRHSDVGLVFRAPEDD